MRALLLGSAQKRAIDVVSTARAGREGRVCRPVTPRKRRNSKRGCAGFLMPGKRFYLPLDMTNTGRRNPILCLLVLPGSRRLRRLLRRYAEQGAQVGVEEASLGILLVADPAKVVPPGVKAAQLLGGQRMHLAPVGTAPVARKIASTAEKYASWGIPRYMCTATKAVSRP